MLLRLGAVPLYWMPSLQTGSLRPQLGFSSLWWRVEVINTMDTGVAANDTLLDVLLWQGVFEVCCAGVRRLRVGGKRTRARAPRLP